VGANGGIHEFADSQFGHVFAKGPTREIARKQLVQALKKVEVKGEIRTTVDYLVQLLETKVPPFTLTFAPSGQTKTQVSFIFLFLLCFLFYLTHDIR